MLNDDLKEMTLKQGEHFSIRGEAYKKDELFHGVNIFVKNNGDNIVKAACDGESIIITIEKSKK